MRLLVNAVAGPPHPTADPISGEPLRGQAAGSSQLSDDGSGEGIGPSGAFAFAADGDVGAGAFEDVEGAFADDGGGEARVLARQAEAKIGEVGALIAG